LTDRALLQGFNAEQTSADQTSAERFHGADATIGGGGVYDKYVTME